MGSDEAVVQRGRRHSLGLLSVWIFVASSEALITTSCPSFRMRLEAFYVGSQMHEKATLLQACLSSRWIDDRVKNLLSEFRRSCSVCTSGRASSRGPPILSWWSGQRRRPGRPIASRPHLRLLILRHAMRRDKPAAAGQGIGMNWAQIGSHVGAPIHHLFYFEILLYIILWKWLSNSYIKSIKTQLMIHLLKNIESHFENIESIF